jgi:hypothetical protein
MMKVLIDREIFCLVSISVLACTAFRRWLCHCCRDAGSVRNRNVSVFFEK